MIESDEPPPNEWVRPWARVVLFTLIGMGVVGWLVVESTLWLKLGMCAVTLVIEVWGLLAAVQWARALARERVSGPFAYWTLVMIGCAAWTIFSIYHALGMLAGDTAQYDMGAAATPAYLAFTCLALALPFHEWAIDRVERAPLKPAQRAPTEQHSERPLDDTPSRQPTRRSKRPKRASGQTERKSGRPMLTLIQNGALAALIAQMSFSPRDMESFERAVLTAHEDPNLSQEEIAARAGVPRQTLGRWMSDAPEVFRAA
ncbi:MAG: hypothetical protein ACK4X1_13160 [Terricaulis sp.]